MACANMTFPNSATPSMRARKGKVNNGIARPMTWNTTSMAPELNKDRNLGMSVQPRLALHLGDAL